MLNTLYNFVGIYQVLKPTALARMVTSRAVQLIDRHSDSRIGISVSSLGASFKSFKSKFVRSVGGDWNFEFLSSHPNWQPTVRLPSCCRAGLPLKFRLWIQSLDSLGSISQIDYSWIAYFRWNWLFLKFALKLLQRLSVFPTWKAQFPDLKVRFSQGNRRTRQCAIWMSAL